MASKVNQIHKILGYMLVHGGITSMEAMKHLGVMRLASRINDMRRKGYIIRSVFVTVKNRDGEECRVKRYSLKGVEDE